MTTPSSLSMIAGLQLSLYAGAATAAYTPSATFVTSKRASPRSGPSWAQQSVMAGEDCGKGGDCQRVLSFAAEGEPHGQQEGNRTDRKSTRLNSSHANISYAVFCLKKKIHI